MPIAIGYRAEHVELLHFLAGASFITTEE